MQTEPAQIRTRTDPLAIIALILGVLSFFLLPVIGAVIAIWLGVRCRRRIAADPSLDGRSVATAAVWLGLAQLVLTVLVFGFVIVARASS